MSAFYTPSAAVQLRMNEDLRIDLVCLSVSASFCLSDAIPQKWLVGISSCYSSVSSTVWE